MFIDYNDKDHIFTLQTKASTYQMYVDPHGYLLHCYYGSKIEGQNLSYLIQQQDRGFPGNPPDAAGDRSLSPDTLPQEYSTFGVGDFRESCLDLQNFHGGIAADFRYVSHRIYKGKQKLQGLPATFGEDSEVESLEIDMEDRVSGVVVSLQYSVFPDDNVITRSARIVNTGRKTVKLSRTLSMCLDNQIPAERDVITFYGRHMGERNLERTSARHGKIRVDSSRGASSPHQNPFLILCDHNADEIQGECFAFSLVYSGSFMAQVELDQIDQLRVVMGIEPDRFSWELTPGASFQTPEVICCYHSRGFDELSNQLHRFQRKHLMRGPYASHPCPVLVNNWEATYFDFNTDKLLDLAQAAKEVGIEMLVLDDGWFGSRNDDTTSLGDWWVNEEKLPGGLTLLSEKLHEYGLKFGLWFEPEMVSPVSELMQSHPEWCLQIPGRPGVTSRAQCVLNMGLSEVQDYLYDKMSEIIRGANLSYMKWDMNRSITDAYSRELPIHRQGEVWHRYILGVYALMDRILTEFPDLLIESCASGGGRYDAGMLYYSPQVWCSDNTDAIDRLKIQYGNSFGFPVKSVGSHVSVSPNHQTGRTVPFETRAVVAMSGSFGYEMDLTKLNQKEKQIVREQILRFKDQRDVLQTGTYHRLTNAQQDRWFTAWMSVSQDRSRAIVSIVLLAPIPNAPILVIKLRGLNPDAFYRDPSGKQYTGEALMKAGLIISPLYGDYTAVQVELWQI